MNSSAPIFQVIAFKRLFSNQDINCFQFIELIGDMMNTFAINQTIVDNNFETRAIAEQHHLRTTHRGMGERNLTSPDGKLNYAGTSAGSLTIHNDHFVAMIMLTATRDLHWKAGDHRAETFNAPAGTVLIIPANCLVHLEWPVQKEHLVVVLDDETIAGICGDNNSFTASELFPGPSRYVDSKCLQVGHLLRAEMQKNAPIIESYLDALRTVFITLLLQNHSMLRRQFDKQEPGGLSYHASRQIEAYIRENFTKKISIADMAASLGVSAGHFLTSFRESFGQTPHQYLLMLRLNEVERYLRETDIPLADIAEKVGFSSQSHMTTALKKNRSVTPGEIRRGRVISNG